MANRGGQRQPGAPWTVKEVARALRVSDAHVYAQVNREMIFAVRVGTTVRIPDGEAQRLLGQKNNQPNAA